MITVKVLLGKDTVSIYRKTGDISSVESTAESGGYVITRHFETEAEYKAYAMAVEDLDGHEDWQMLAPAVTPEAPFRKGEFVRLTDDAIKRIRESFGDGPADYRKEMILEGIGWCRYEGTWVIEVGVRCRFSAPLDGTGSRGYFRTPTPAIHCDISYSHPIT